MGKSSKGILAVMLAVFIWGSSYVVLKIGLEEIPPITFGLLRGIIASVFLYIIILFRKETKLLLKVLKKDLSSAFSLGLVGIFLFNIIQNYGIPKTTSSLASVLININPLFILILAVLFLKEKFSINKLIGLVVGFLGMGFIVLSGEDIKALTQSQSFVGNGLMIATAFIWAVYSVLNKKFSKNITLLY